MMPVPRRRATPRRWLPLPRRTARLRLTLTCGGLFMLTGAVFLASTYLLFRAVTPRSKNPGGSGPRIPGLLPKSGVSGVRLQEGQFAQQLGKAAAAAQYTSDVHRLLITSVIALAIVAVLALGLGWFVAGRILRPVRAITATARRISASNLHQRLALDGADEEFKNLGDTLDELFARLDAAFDAQQHFVANASHELRTPLTAERALLQVALDDPYTTSEDWRSTAKEVLTANSAQERLIEALLALASSEAGLGHRERIDLPAICRNVLARPGPGAGAPGLQIETALCSATLDGDPRLIERLVANLADNAIGHNVTGGHVWVATAVTDGTAVLSVANTGPLIPASDVNRLFQPFQRLDPGRTHHNGHGLGLSIVKAIATAHGATITARPRLEGGLSIEVTFPPPATISRAVPGPPSSVSGGAAAPAALRRAGGARSRSPRSSTPPHTGTAAAV
jgi:signal transduction histidine kinase